MPIPLWSGSPPGALQAAPPETVDRYGHIGMISMPAMSVYLPPPDRRTGMAFLVLPGGGYGKMDWNTHVVNMVRHLNPRGIAIIGLKYRTRPPYSTAAVQKVALLDAERAVRIIRSRAAEWGIDPHRIGVVGYSAGAHLAMNVAGRSGPGEPQAADPVERESSRPDFVVGLSTWAFRKKESPFSFQPGTPPVFMGHARNDGVPIELTFAIEKQLEPLHVPVHIFVTEEGGHGAFNLLPNRIRDNFPGTKWPEELLAWLATLPRAGPAAAAAAARSR